MTDTKRWFESTGVWGGLATVGFAVAGITGWQVAPADQAATIAHITAIATALTGLVSIWGRVTATRKIG